MPDAPISRFSRLMATTDGSEAAAVAVERAIEIAAAHDATLDLVHVASEELSRLEPRVYAREVDGWCDPLEAIASDRGVKVTRHVVAGRASDTLVEQAGTLKSDLVVLGSRGRTQFGRILLGSVTDRVIRRLPQPVLVVHPDDTRSMADVRTVVAAIDFSDNTEDVVAAAASLLAARTGPATLDLVHADAFAADPMVAAAADGDEATRRGEELRAKVDELAASLAEDGLTVTSAVAPVYPVELIDQEVEKLSADAVVVGCTGRGGLERLLLGSVAQRVVEHAKCPVVVAGR